MYDRKLAEKLKYDQMVLCMCPHYCDEGFQVGTWNGEEFESSTDDNGAFDNYVLSFIPLDEEGIPFKLD